MPSKQSCAILILAAGQGTRMKTSNPKVLNELVGQPTLFHILDRVREAFENPRVGIVVGYGREEVEAAVKRYPFFDSLEISFIHQAVQAGTGDAARTAMQSPWAEGLADEGIPILVLPGDAPLITKQLLSELGSAMTRATALRLVTCSLEDPSGYGRVVRRGKRGPVQRIVEERDAKPREKAINEVAMSIYLFQSSFLKSSLERLSNKNSQGEYYLTDIIELASRAKKRIDVLQWNASEDLMGINNQWELSEAGRILRMRILKKWALEGVRFLDPASTWVEPHVKLSAGVVVHPGVLLGGKTEVHSGVEIEPNCRLKDMVIRKDCHLKQGTVAEQSTVGERCKIGPYAHLRPGNQLGNGVKIGNFVELKACKIGDETSIAHLSYLGDADVGKKVNIGCGFVTCNYDGRVKNGRRKHPTTIGDEVFMGSDCQAIAPIVIGSKSYVASGSTLTMDVPEGALAIGRSRQVNKLDMARRFRPE